MAKKWWIFEYEKIEKGSLQYWRAERGTYAFILVCVASFFSVVGILHYFEYGLDAISDLLLVVIASLVPMMGLGLSDCNRKIKELSEDSKI